GDLGLEGKVVFFYGGNIGVAQDMDNIIRLADGLRDLPQAHFLLVGEGSEVARLEELIQARGLENIQILPAVGQKEYLGMLSEFDVGLISLAGNLTTQNIPGKLLGYMYYSIPVLASINPGNDLKEMLESHHAGLVSLNGNDSELLEQARSLAEDCELRKTMGTNSRRLLEDTFSVEKAAGQIIRNAGNIVR
ncbi:MAG: glycosyltransferase family 4 protein, partial [bacterium]|nr:glycosyltransferase family 4 protein [bacterium]